jgi:hypothetical protein
LKRADEVTYNKKATVAAAEGGKSFGSAADLKV